MTIEWNLILRLFIAGLLGGLVGFEREFRAKEAGLRTHFVVALGSALFMIISQHAFPGMQHDAARVAAQVVSGIGFLGAGVIIFQKNVIRGVTTAAGLWVVAAIGLAAGAGMYAVSIAASLMTLICLEAMHFIHLRHGEKVVSITVATDRPESVLDILDSLKKANVNVESYSLQEGQIQMTLRLRILDYEKKLRTVFNMLEGAKIESLS
ncbi:MAG: MgtC/SapB family protein [Bacteroidales bacterium]|nr:MgtC/SapB family protein [Bacteroidales bacterium]